MFVCLFSITGCQLQRSCLNVKIIKLGFQKQVLSLIPSLNKAKSHHLFPVYFYTIHTKIKNPLTKIYQNPLVDIINHVNQFWKRSHQDQTLTLVKSKRESADVALVAAF